MNFKALSNIGSDYLPALASRSGRYFLCVLGCLLAGPLGARELSGTIEIVKPSIVGIATFQQTRSPAISFMGTGFAVGDGTLVVTNAHVIPKLVDADRKETIVVMVASGGKEPGLRSATQVAHDREHDLALLRISGAALPAMELGDSGAIREGQPLAFTGFPIGMVLGFHPVTHRGMVSSITPVVSPALTSRQLDVKMIAQLQKSAYTVFQLDGTAYPGNSGSPVYDPESGVVYGIINMVLVKGMKENALSHPSGITYAIPVNHVRDLMRQK